MTKTSAKGLKVKQYYAVVTVQCVGCKKRRDIREGEIESGDDIGPMCDKCYLPMVAIEAKVRRDNGR